MGEGYNGRFKAVFSHQIVEAVCAAVSADCIACFSLVSISLLQRMNVDWRGDGGYHVPVGL